MSQVRYPSWELCFIGSSLWYTRAKSACLAFKIPTWKFSEKKVEKSAWLVGWLLTVTLHLLCYWKPTFISQKVLFLFGNLSSSPATASVPPSREQTQHQRGCREADVGLAGRTAVCQEQTLPTKPQLYSFPGLNQHTPSARTDRASPRGSRSSLHVLALPRFVNLFAPYRRPRQDKTKAPSSICFSQGSRTALQSPPVSSQTAGVREVLMK